MREQRIRRQRLRRCRHFRQSIVERSLADPRDHQIDGRLVEAGILHRAAAERHAAAGDTRGALDFLDQIAVGWVVGLDSKQRRLLDARHIHDVAVGMACRQVLYARQRATEAGMAGGTDRRKDLGLQLR